MLNQDLCLKGIGFLVVYSSWSVVVTGLICYNCKYVSVPGLCNKTTTCTLNQNWCVTAENVNDMFQFSYKLGCAGREFCGGGDKGRRMTLRNKRFLGYKCCHDDLCNSGIHPTTKNTGTVKNNSTTTIVTTKTTKKVKNSSMSTLTTTNTETIKTTPMSTTNSQSTAKPCSGRDYHIWRRHCYFLSRFTYPWGTGHDRTFNPCQIRHMKIAEIQNIYERHAIVHFLRNSFKYMTITMLIHVNTQVMTTGLVIDNESVWLGATHKGAWFWLNGEGITEGHFVAADTQSDGECLVLKGNHYIGEDCHRHFAHLCEEQI